MGLAHYSQYCIEKKVSTKSLSNWSVVLDWGLMSAIYDIEAAEKLGNILIKSGALKGAQRPETGTLVALDMMTRGMSPTEWLARYYVMNGVITTKYTTMLADYQKGGGRVRWVTGLQDGEKASAVFWRHDDEGELEVVYSLKDAAREGLVNSPTWKKHAPDMLRARLVVKTLRMIAPDLVSVEDDYSVIARTAPVKEPEPAKEPESVDLERVFGDSLKVVEKMLVDRKIMESWDTMPPDQLQSIINNKEAVIRKARKHEEATK